MTPRRGAVAGVTIAAVGAAVSAYLTVVHYADVAPACVTSGAIDCGAVTSSTYSLVPGTQIPITIIGIVWFALAGAGFLLAGGEGEPPWLPVAHFVLAAAGVLAVLYLVYAEIVVINRICEWCTLVHLLVLATFVLTLRRLQTG
jgi:uncharacterized membrane protein